MQEREKTKNIRVVLEIILRFSLLFDWSSFVGSINTVGWHVVWRKEMWEGIKFERNMDMYKVVIAFNKYHI